MIEKLKCMLFGHKRGRLVASVFDAKIGKQVTTYACPRCGHRTVYKVKVPG